MTVPMRRLTTPSHFPPSPTPSLPFSRRSGPGGRWPRAAGEYLYREGDSTYDFYVILSGVVEVVVRSDGEERIVARHGPGRAESTDRSAGVSVGPHR